MCLPHFVPSRLLSPTLLTERSFWNLIEIYENNLIQGVMWHYQDIIKRVNQISYRFTPCLRIGSSIFLFCIGTLCNNHLRVSKPPHNNTIHVSASCYGYKHEVNQTTDNNPLSTVIQA